VRAASRPLDEQRAAAADPGAALVVAACGHVREPGRAVAEPCWTLPDTTTELTLAEILTERLHAQHASQAWQDHYTAVIQRREDIDELSRLQAPDGLAHALGNARAAAVLRALIGADPAAFLDAEPDLARRIVDWTRQRRRIGRFEARDLARPWIQILEDRFDQIWGQQARQFLAAQARLAAGDPAVYRIAAALADGNLVDDLTVLDAPPGRTRQASQDEVLGDYPARRAAAIEPIWQALPRRARRHTSRQDLAERFDAEHLLVCATCTMAYPLPETLYDRCPHCDDLLLDWPERTKVTSLAQRLNVIRARLAEAG
jgi:hypothetical protein